MTRHVSSTSYYLMILYLISMLALVLQFCSTFKLIFLLVFTFVIVLFSSMPIFSSFVSLLFSFWGESYFYLAPMQGLPPVYLFPYFVKKKFFGGGGVTAKLMFGYNMGVFGGWWGPKLWIHRPGCRFWLCPVELANVPGCQMTTRHSFPRLGPNPRVITALVSYSVTFFKKDEKTELSKSTSKKKEKKVFCRMKEEGQIRQNVASDFFAPGLSYDLSKFSDKFTQFFFTSKDHNYYPGQKNWDSHAPAGTGAWSLEHARACSSQACLSQFFWPR